MSVTGLQVESLPSGGDSILAWLGEGERWLQGAADLQATQLGDTGLVEAVRRLGSMVSQVTAVKLGVVAEVDRRSAARRVTGATSTAAWLRADGMSAGAAARQVALAGSLAEHDPTRAALAAGAINPEQAAVITGALDALSEQVSDQDKTATETRLLDAAGRLDLGRLRKHAVAEAARVDPGGSGDLLAQERAAKARRDLVLYRGGDGMHHLRGVFDTAAAATLAAALDPLSAAAATLAAALDPLSAPSPASDGSRDTRTPGRRRADALVELARRALGGGGLPDTGGVRPQVVVTMTLAQLTEQIDAADGGCAQVAGGTVREPLSAATARQIACDAQIIPAVLGGPSQVLDWGLAQRTATPIQRRALALRDGGCTAPGCDRPPDWCEAHHLVPWQHGGATNIEQMALVCDAHHDIAHHDGWTITYNPTHGVIWHPPPTPPPEPPW